MQMNISGLDVLDKKLAKLDAAVAKKALRGAMLKATLPTQKKAKAITPVGRYKKPRKDRTPGTMKKAVRRRFWIASRTKRFSAAMRVSFRDKKAFYWKWVTGGTKPHDLNSGSKTARKQVGFKRQKASTIKQRMHPGIKGRDVLGIAFRLTRKGMDQRFANELTKRIEQASK